MTTLEIPDLSGVATKDLVEQIGGGNFKASYINWSRTMNLMRKHAPGWLPETIVADGGGLVHESPVGGYLLIRYRHVSGFVTPEVPQAVMNHRNNSIALADITSRDVTDTHRRGCCLVAAMQFGLGYELWAKIALESGYSADEPSEAPVAASKAPPKASKAKDTETAKEPTEADFKKIATDKGLCEQAVNELTTKVNGKWGSGIKTLNSKDSYWVEGQNARFPAEEY